MVESTAAAAAATVVDIDVLVPIDVSVFTLLPDRDCNGTCSVVDCDDEEDDSVIVMGPGCVDSTRFCNSSSSAVSSTHTTLSNTASPAIICGEVNPRSCITYTHGKKTSSRIHKHGSYT